MKSIELIKFGQAIKAYRQTMNLSQEKLAERCNLHKNYIGQVERGERNASLKNILKITNGLSIKPSELFTSYENNQ